LKRLSWFSSSLSSGTARPSSSRVHFALLSDQQSFDVAKCKKQLIEPQMCMANPVDGLGQDYAIAQNRDGFIPFPRSPKQWREKRRETWQSELASRPKKAAS
jgi:hypothetical protein